MEYEGIHLICFKCGRYGHRGEGCPESTNTNPMAAKEVKGDLVGGEQPEETREVSPYGPWMLAKYQRRKQQPSWMRDRQTAVRRETPAARVGQVGLTGMGHKMGHGWKNDRAREAVPSGGPRQVEDGKGKGGSRFCVLDGTEDDLDSEVTIAHLKQRIQEIQGVSERRQASPNGGCNIKSRRETSPNLMGRGRDSQNRFMVGVAGHGHRSRFRRAGYKTQAEWSGNEDVGPPNGRPSQGQVTREKVN